MTPPSLMSRLLEHADARPSATALTFPGDSRAGSRTLTWSELAGRVLHNAALMQRQGVANRDIAVIVHESVHDQVLAFLSALAAGARPTILSYPSAKQSTERFQAMFSTLVDQVKPRWISVASPWRELLAEYGPQTLQALVDETDDQPIPSKDPDWPTFLQFSSGTTGLRKGVEITASHISHQLETYGRTLGVRHDDVIVSWLPLYHDMGLVAAFLFGIHHGIHAVHLSPFQWLADPAGYVKAISDARGTISHIPNFGLNFLAARVDPIPLLHDGVTLASLRALINCSEPVRADSTRRFLERFAVLGMRHSALQSCYAMAECTFAVTQSNLAKPPRVDVVDRQKFLDDHLCEPAAPGAETLEFVSCGPPIQGIDVRIVNADAPRQVGEIAIRGPSVVERYLGIQRTEAFPGEGWYHTGDLGYLADGELYVTGRSGDLVICRGQNIYPNDVESTLAEVDGLRPGRIVVFGVEDPTSGTESLVAMAERKGDPDETKVQISARKAVLDAHGIALDDLVLVARDSLLKSTSGKMSRSKNLHAYLQSRPVPDVAPTESTPPDDRPDSSPDPSAETSTAAAAPPEDPSPLENPEGMDTYVLADGVDISIVGDEAILTHPRGTKVAMTHRLFRGSESYSVPRTRAALERYARKHKQPTLIGQLIDQCFLVSSGTRSVFSSDQWHAYVPVEHSKTLVIQFRGGSYDLVAGVPPREFAKDTGIDAHNLLSIRDLNSRFYLRGPSPDVLSFDAMVAWIRGFIAAVGPFERIYTIGNSMGAYAALRAGHALGVDAAFAFGPADPGGKPERATHVFLTKDNQKSTFHVWYCNGHAEDAAVAATLIDRPGIELHPIPGKRHWVARILHSRGELPRLVEPPAAAAVRANTRPNAEIQADEVLALLRQVIPRPPFELSTTTTLTGLLDSFGSTHLLSLIKQRYGSDIDASKVTDEDLSSADRIVSMVRRQWRGADINDSAAPTA